MENTIIEEYPSILTPQECMKTLGIGRLSMFYNLFGSGELPAKRIGNKIWRISKVDLITYITNT